MLIPFQVNNAASETSLYKFIETSAEIDPSLPTKIRSKKLAKTGLGSCEEYKAYRKTLFQRTICFPGKILNCKYIINREMLFTSSHSEVITRN